jgi:hypothetical protein
MRESCLTCVAKHLAQASVLMTEVQMGYPLHRFLVWGHLAEAEAESLAIYPDLAAEIRMHRLMYEENVEYKIPIMNLLQDVSDLMGTNNATQAPTL